MENLGGGCVCKRGESMQPRRIVIAQITYATLLVGGKLYTVYRI